MKFKSNYKAGFISVFFILSACASQPSEQGVSKNLIYKLGKEAALAYKNKNWKVAEKKYSLLIAESPGTAEIWFKLGNVFARTSRPDKAIAAYKEAVVRNPQYEQAWRNLGIISLRKTTHLYIEMLQHLDDSSESYIRAKKTSEVLLKLIKKNQERTMPVKKGKADL